MSEQNASKARYVGGPKDGETEEFVISPETLDDTRELYVTAPGPGPRRVRYERIRIKDAVAIYIFRG